HSLPTRRSSDLGLTRSAYHYPSYEQPSRTPKSGVYFVESLSTGRNPRNAATLDIHKFPIGSLPRHEPLDMGPHCCSGPRMFSPVGIAQTLPIADTPLVLGH